MIGRAAAFIAGLSATGAPLPAPLARAAALLAAADIDDGDLEWRRRGAAGDGSAAAALRADILAHPEDPGYSLSRDDALRLAYAELIEPEDHARSEVITMQIEGRRAGQTRKLLAHHGRGWSAIKDLVPEYRFYRGFVGHMTLSANDFLERGERLYALEPITEVALRGGVREQPELLFSSPLLGRLRALDLSGQALGDAGVARLVSSPHLGNLVALNLDGNRLTVAGLRALASSDSVPRLRFATFAGNLDEVGPLGDDEDELTPLAQQLEEEHAGRIPWLHSTRAWRPGELEALTVATAGEAEGEASSEAES